MSFTQVWLNYLDAMGLQPVHIGHSVNSTVIHHPADPDATSAHPVAEPILCEGDDGHLMVIVPAGWCVDIVHLSDAVRSHRFRIVTDTEVERLIASHHNGDQKRMMTRMPVYLDRELARRDVIAFEPGSQPGLVHVKVADFCRAVQAIVGMFSWPDYQAQYRHRHLAARAAAAGA